MKNNENQKTFLCNISTKLSEWWNKSLSSSIVSHDEGINADNSYIVKTLKKIPIKKYIFSPVKKRVSSIIDNSFIISKLSLLYEYVLSLSVKCFGCCIATFTAIALFFNFLNHSFNYDIALNSAVVILVVLPLLLSSKNISLAICESGIFSYLFIELLHCEKLLFYSKKESRGSISGSFIVGFIASFFTLAYTREEIFVFVVLAIMSVVFMCRPESAALTLVLIFPFCQFKYIAFLSMVALISFFVKVLRGKRNLYLNIYDIPVFLFALIYLFIPSKHDSIVTVLVLSLLYLLFSSMMRSEELMQKCLKNIFISSSIFAIYNIIILFLDKNIDTLSSLFTGEVRHNTVFSNSVSISVLYACAFIIGCGLISFGGTRRKRIVFLGLIANFAALCFCGAELTATACLIAFIVLFVSMLKNKILVLLVSSALASLMINFFGLFSDTVNGFDKSIDLISKHSKYVLWGTENSHLIYIYERIPDAGSLWIQLTFWGGLLVAFFIFVTAVVFMRNGFTIGYPRVSLKMKSFSTSVSSAVLLYVISSFGVFSWNDYRVFSLFWILGGLSAASRRLLKNENCIESVSQPYEM